MRTTIDKAGRVVIPTEIRRKARLEPGTPLEVLLDETNSVRLVRSVPGPRLVKVGGRLLARPAARGGGVDVGQLVEDERARWPW
jgi:AbrB family looped-hinge helix DNA binding protein